MTEKKGLFSRLREGLFKSREHMSVAMEAAVQDDRPIDEVFYDEDVYKRQGRQRQRDGDDSGAGKRIRHRGGGRGDPHPQNRRRCGRLHLSLIHI